MKKKIISLLIIISMVFTCVSMMNFTVFAAATSGTCGDNLTWSYSGDTLTISGSGNMYDYSSTYSSSAGQSITTAPWNSYYSTIKTVIIGDNATIIGGYAFCGCSGLTSVTISDSVTSIGTSAFRGCSGLTSITIPDSVISIGNSAFSGCTVLMSINIGNNVKSIGNFAFKGCSQITSITIPDSITSIGISTFSGCTGLINVTIPNSITSIGDCAFADCSSLISIIIPDSAIYIGDDSFYNCTSLTSITLPFVGNTLNGTSNTHFGYIFGAPDTGYNGYYTPSSLKTVVITKASSIGEHAFYYCSGITSIAIPDSVTSIGEDAFEGCSGLTSVNITDIEAWNNIKFNSSYSNPLSYAQNLYLNGKKVTDLVIPSTITNIGDWAFYKYTGLTSVTIPSSVTSIGNGAFMYCSGLTRVDITDISAWCEISFKNFTSNPLYYAHHLYLNGKEITDLVIPNNITSIGDYTFSGCTGLTNITIPDSVTSIGNYAFYCCTNLNIHTSADAYAKQYAISKSMSYSIHSGGEATCSHKAICEICGAEYGEKDLTNHTPEVRYAYPATAFSQGYTGDTYCAECGELLSKGTATDYEYDENDNQCSVVISAQNATSEDFATVEYQIKGVDYSTEQFALTDGKTVSGISAKQVITLYATNENNNFAGWYKVEGGKATLISNKCQVQVLTNDTDEEFKAVYFEEAENKLNFKDVSGNLITSICISDLTKDNIPDMTSNLPGVQFIGWLVNGTLYTNEELLTLAGTLNSDTVASAKYQMTTKLTLMLNGEVMEDVSGSYDSLTIITVKAKSQDVNGKGFSYWQTTDASGNTIKISSKEKYSFYITKDTVLTAVYGEEPTNCEVNIIGLDAGTNSITATVQRSVLFGFTVVEQGILLTKDTTIEDNNFVLASGNGNIIQVRSNGTANNGVLIATKKNVVSGDTWRFKGYVIYQDAEGHTFTAYSYTASTSIS